MAWRLFPIVRFAGLVGIFVLGDLTSQLKAEKIALNSMKEFMQAPLSARYCTRPVCSAPLTKRCYPTSNLQAGGMIGEYGGEMDVGFWVRFISSFLER